MRIKQPAMVFLLAPKSPACSPKETSKDRVMTSRRNVEQELAHQQNLRAKQNKDLCNTETLSSEEGRIVTMSFKKTRPF